MREAIVSIATPDIDPDGTATDREIRYIADGCETLGEVAKKLRELADQYESWEKKGWQLSQPVDNLYLFMDRDGKL